MTLYYHPKDTVTIYAKHRGNIENVWYWVHYFQQKNHQVQSSNARLWELDKEILVHANARPTIESVHHRQQRMIASSLQTHHVKWFRGRVEGKLAHGLGGAHVRETSLTLHALYGIPYLPSSSLKGAIRHWAIQAFFQGRDIIEHVNFPSDWAEDDIPAETRELAWSVAKELFGTQGARGSLQIFDSFALPDFCLRPDVISVHYKPYYDQSGRVPPTDDTSPVPAQFYVVEDAEFHFYLALRKNVHSKIKGVSATDLIDIAAEWLQKTLSEQGIGSKTSSGYGYFYQLDDESSRLETMLAELQSERTRKLELYLERKKELEAQRLEEEKQKRLAAMTPGERLVYEIRQLTDHQVDQERSKTELYGQVLSHAQEGEVEPARALKEYWENTGSWRVKKKTKQYQKVLRIAEILGERM